MIPESAVGPASAGKVLANQEPEGTAARSAAVFGRILERLRAPRGGARGWIAAWLWLLCSPLAAQQTVLLNNAQPISFDLPANNFTTSLAFDLPPDLTRFRVQTSAANSAADVDVFLRYGERFPNQTVFDQPPDFDTVAAMAHYRSISSANDESIVVSAQSHRPPRAGRWHLLVINTGSAASSVTVRVDWGQAAPAPAQPIVRFDLPCPPNSSTCNCDLTPWNDPSPGPAAPGNPGTTLGEKRRAAAQRAAELLLADLKSEVPLSIQACWADLGTGTRVTVAQAGPVDYYIDDPSLTWPLLDNGIGEQPAPFLPVRRTLVAAAPGNRLAGTRRCGVRGGSCANSVDLRITFNSKIDTPEALGARGFYYGFNPGAPAGDIDFIGTTLHELAHGIGFLSLVNTGREGEGNEPVGALAIGREDWFAQQIRIAQPGQPLARFARVDNATRATALTSLTGLQWTDTRALNPAFGWLPQSGDAGVRLYAPGTLESGSTLSHLDLGLYPNQLMSPRASDTRTLGLALPMLEAVGWSPAAQSYPRTPTIPTGLWFDPRRSGHGFDIQPASGPTGDDYLVVVFYTFRPDGAHEYYIAYGPVIDGVFRPAYNGEPHASAPGDTMSRYLVRLNPSVVRLDPASDALMAIDFNVDPREGSDAIACRDGRTLREQHAVMTTLIDGVRSVWCLEPLVAQANRVTPDDSGLWHLPSESGYGLTVATGRLADGGTLLFGVLYYPDANEQPHWAYFQSEDFRGDATLPVFERQGFCRNCESIPPQPANVGSVRIRRGGDATAPRLILDLDVASGRTPGTRIVRQSLPFERLSLPPRVLSPRP